MQKLITRTIVSLAVALGLTVGLLFASGCATAVTTQGTKVMQIEKYQDMQLNDDGIKYKIPVFVGDLNDKKWSIQDHRYGKNTFGMLLSKDKVAISMLLRFDKSEAVLLAIVITVYDDGETEQRYYIYNGKVYPKEVDEPKMKAYTKMVFKQDR